MASTAIQRQLVDAGNRLANPPSSVDELLPLLGQVESYLAKLEQSPTDSTQRALAPAQNALVTDQLLRHPDADVRVAVAACISEILRITAPNVPYDDEQMVGVLELIVSSFDNLDDTTNRAYSKTVVMLESMARVRACVLMLDLQCDALITDMFHKFFNTVRDYHPENVVSAMETIMTLVIQESEDNVPLETITTLLASVDEGNEEVSHVARKMARRVIQTCCPTVSAASTSPADDGMEDKNGGPAVGKEGSSGSTGSWLGSRFQWLFR